MALFNRKKADAKVESKKTPAAPQGPTIGRDLSKVLVKPRITEKAVGKSEQNVYTFIVRSDATKFDVRDAVKTNYNVSPLRVNIVNRTPRQHKSARLNRVVTAKGVKKAYVYLKKGDSINIV